MCAKQHPVLRDIACMRNRGHNGLHWYQARWGSDEETIAAFEQAVEDYKQRQGRSA